MLSTGFWLMSKFSFLYPFTKLYSALAAAEKTFFSGFPFLKYKARVPVISVGNITMGGTGKTPVLFELLKTLDRSGKRLAVITRGYQCPWERSFYVVIGSGPHPRSLTDETLLLNRKFPHVPIYVGKNRAHSVRMAERISAPEVILLDDGFQYRRLAGTTEIVLWDASNDPLSEDLIPAGTLREPLSSLKRASILLITRCEALSPGQLTSLSERLQKFAPGVPLIPFQTVSDCWYNHMGKAIPLADGPGKAIAFAAIGNPQSFLFQLRQNRVEVIQSSWFRDHYRFSANDFEKLLGESQERDLPLVCTEKDRQKIPPEWLELLKPLSLSISMHPRGDPNQLKKFLSNIVMK